MDDELKAIQDDLDKVLERLAKYMSNETPEDETLSPREFDKEDAARVALHYVSRGAKSLEPSILTAHVCISGEDSDKEVFPPDSLLNEHPTDRRSIDCFMKALRSLESWLITHWPLEDEHVETLALAVSAWSNKECQYIGENVGLELTPKKCIDRRKIARDSAAWDAYTIHQSDPVANPIGETLFEKAGKPYGMSASVVSRAYYSKDAKLLRGAFDSGAPPLPREGAITVGEWLKEHDWSKTDEN